VHTDVQLARVLGVAIAAPVAALLATILLAWIYIQSRSSGRTLLGAVAPPGVATSTTLLVTDIQVRQVICWSSFAASTRSMEEKVLRNGRVTRLTAAVVNRGAIKAKHVTYST
jgi:hypothetical protein